MLTNSNIMTKKVTSGLQRQFKECYRESLKMITSKPIIYRKNWFQFISHQFRSQTMQESFQKRDYESVEYQLRRIKNQLELYSKPSVQQVHLPSISTHHIQYHLGWIAKGGKQGLLRHRDRS
ncbi:hypothetical protein PSTG_04297 [Puccinia striiformis f. sp. tritici PST-78]|uniref:Uncharacterized protein n=1 Tax=Puccinia striiformis f. sp. tritici PST-78 TaxID=1165861 RepID=A0A0L0VSY4_9BASI|nr:hypothetical protein PSTG_04297 [Puccinia striiformis f. sp. tritici PST-78]